MITRDELIAFETEIGERFNNREIRAPIHLYHGNEDQIIQVFAGIDITEIGCVVLGVIIIKPC